MIYPVRLYGLGELAFGGVGVVKLRIPSPSQMYLPEIGDIFILLNGIMTLWFHDWMLPETNLRLTSDKRYPPPTNSNSIPDNVVPSQLNWVLMTAGVDGPVPTSNRARNVPTPLFSECCEISVKFQTKRFDSPSQAECGFDWTFLTLPSTGTDSATLSNGDGDAIAWLLYL